MKKPFALILSLGLILIILTGCNSKQNNLQNTYETSVNTESKNITEFTYVNSIYGFQMTFPATWGEVIGKELPGDEIVISSKIDENKSFSVIMVGKSYKDTMTNNEIFLGENKDISFYARVNEQNNKQTNNVKEELQTIAETFKTN